MKKNKITVNKKAIKGMKKIMVFLFLFSAFAFITSCNSDDNFKVDLSDVPTPQIEIKRYARTMFAVPPDSFIAAVRTYRDTFPLFLGGDINDTNALLQLKAFFTDRYMVELNNQVQKEFPDLKELKAGLQKAFRHFKYYFPKEPVPQFYTYVSGLDYQFPVKFAGDAVIIGLDLYLGKDTKAYKVSGFPQYGRRWMNRRSIVPDVMKEICSGYMPESRSDDNLLKQMVERGKKLYFTKAMIPDIPDTLLFKYTSTQMQWIKEYEAKVWAFIVENRLLYDNKKNMLNKFTGDGPFTDYFSKKSPPRLAEYLGFRIVKNYMDETGEPLRKLLPEENAPKILKLSRYKPEI